MRRRSLSVVGRVHLRLLRLLRVYLRIRIARLRHELLRISIRIVR